ncbi:MAG: metalloregulator ArsR/SmtB family transcription factor [Marinilabiliales bacterium]|nr:metalloregulator ArsR/SmtB family transcription factor [Marinilabiliales bacterium]
MVSSKKELFTVEQQGAAELFKALAHPARIAILEYLATTRDCITGDISEILPLARTTVNQHLSALKSAGFIQGSISGAKTYYCIDPTKVEKLKSMTNNLLRELSDANPHCLCNDSSKPISHEDSDPLYGKQLP